MSEHAWSWTGRTNFPSRRGAHEPFMREVLAQLAELGWANSDLFGIEMALEESLTNAIRHGNRLDESKQVVVECKVSPGPLLAARPRPRPRFQARARPRLHGRRKPATAPAAAAWP